MKYGKIYTYKNKMEAVELIGKKVLFSDSLKAINEQDSEEAYISKLDKIGDNPDYPFQTELEKYQFIREIVEEKPKYRPFTPEELKKQVGKVFMEKETDSVAVATVFQAESDTICLARYNSPYNAEEFLKDWVFADDEAPCGVKVEG